MAYFYEVVNPPLNTIDDDPIVLFQIEKKSIFHDSIHVELEQVIQKYNLAPKLRVHKENPQIFVNEFK